MKNLLQAALIFTIAAIGHGQTVTLDITVGILTDSTGTTRLANGALFQVIASPDNLFTAPIPSAFIGGNDAILWSGSFDSTASGVSGAMQVFLPDLSATTFAGNYLLVRWFPSLTVADSTPGVIAFGQYGYPNDSSWIAPDRGGTLSYDFRTVSSGYGSVPDSFGAATYSTAVPEPATYATFTGFLAFGFVVWRRRRAVRT